MFSTLPETTFKFSITFILSSANTLNLDQSEILLFGKEKNWVLHTYTINVSTKQQTCRRNLRHNITGTSYTDGYTATQTNTLTDRPMDEQTVQFQYTPEDLCFTGYNNTHLDKLYSSRREITGIEINLPLFF